jgi:hypothetical protein
MLSLMPFPDLKHLLLLRDEPSFIPWEQLNATSQQHQIIMDLNHPHAGVDYGADEDMLSSIRTLIGSRKHSEGVEGVSPAVTPTYCPALEGIELRGVYFMEGELEGILAALRMRDATGSRNSDSSVNGLGRLAKAGARSQRVGSEGACRLTLKNCSADGSNAVTRLNINNLEYSEVVSSLERQLQETVAG